MHTSLIDVSLLSLASSGVLQSLSDVYYGSTLCTDYSANAARTDKGQITLNHVGGLFTIASIAIAAVYVLCLLCEAQARLCPRRKLVVASPSTEDSGDSPTLCGENDPVTRARIAAAVDKQKQATAAASESIMRRHLYFSFSRLHARSRRQRTAPQSPPPTATTASTDDTMCVCEH